MRDGFYLSTYLNPAGLDRLALVRLRHSHNISLWEKRDHEVRLIRHWELERCTGQKTHRTPFLTLSEEVVFINDLLAPLGLALDDMVEIWGTPDLATGDDHHWVHEVPDVAFHAVAHLYSAILMDSDVFFGGTILGLAVDRGPDRLLDSRLKDHWFGGCVVRRGEIEIFPVESPGPLYCEARDRFGMREGTLMALATATTATGSTNRQRALYRHRFDGADVVERSREVLDGICRDVEASHVPDPDFSERESLVSAVMKEVQAISVEIMERNVEMIANRFELDTGNVHLALGGGYALNCPTNSHLMEKYGFRGLLAPPSVGDEGQSVGIALAAFHKKLACPFTFSYPGPYVGRADTETETALRDFADFVIAVEPYDEERAVEDLLAGPIVWLAGGAEVGPRALGNRSILGNPTSYATKETMNSIKQREWWRPVAPVVLEESLEDWFENARPSPFMLETFTIRAARRPEIPAVAHIDHSARVQSVTRAQNRRLYDLIAAFARRTAVPILCNTSLNDRGEPIVDTLAQALNFCLRKGLPTAYVDGRRVSLGNFDSYEVDSPLPREHTPFSEVQPERAAALRRDANPFHLSDLYLHVYRSDLQLRARYEITTSGGARAAREEIKRRLASDPALRERSLRMMEKNRIHFSAFGWQPLIPDLPLARPDE